MTIHHPLSRTRDVSRQIMRALSIAADYKDDNTIQTIADTYNISKGTVLRVARQFALPKRLELRMKRDAGIVEHLRAKVALKAIANEFSVTESRVSQIAKKEGLNRYGPGGASPWRGKEKQIIAAYEAGVKVAAIEEQYKIEHSNLYKLLRANNVKFKRRKK